MVAQKTCQTAKVKEKYDWQNRDILAIELGTDSMSNNSRKLDDSTEDFNGESQC